MSSQKQVPNPSNELWGSSTLPPQSVVNTNSDIMKSGSRGPPPGLSKYRNSNNLSNFVGMWNGSSWLLLKNLTTQVNY